MVHALKESWRVLVPGGILLDLRPLSGNWPVAVAAGGRVTFVGLLDQPAADPDDLAANASLAQIEREGWFAREREGVFDFAWYWDTPDEMKAYIAEKWTYTRLRKAVLTRVRRLIASAGEGARVRVLGNIVISRWRKQPKV